MKRLCVFGTQLLAVALVVTGCSSTQDPTGGSTTQAPIANSVLIPGTLTAGALAAAPSTDEVPPVTSTAPTTPDPPAPQSDVSIDPNLRNLLDIGDKDAALITQIVADPAAWHAGEADGNYIEGSITKIEFDTNQDWYVAKGLVEYEPSRYSAELRLEDAQKVFFLGLENGSSLTPADTGQIESDLAVWNAFSAKVRSGG